MAKPEFSMSVAVDLDVTLAFAGINFAVAVSRFLSEDNQFTSGEIYQLAIEHIDRCNNLLQG
jgi:hypothetical protein